MDPSLRKAAIENLARQYDLIAVYAFGSQAQEVMTWLEGAPLEIPPFSDVDIGILPAPGRHLTAEEKVTLTLALEDLFGVGRVDLVVLPEAPPFLALDIVCGELLHTGDASAEAEYQLYVLRRVGDLAPFERERRRMILAGEAF